MLCFGLAYFASGRVPLSLKSISTVNLVASFLMQKLARSSSEMHRELKKTLISSGLEEEFIERLDSLEFTEEGLREAARLLQEKTPEDISDLADAFVKSYRQEPSVQKKVYALVQYITRTLGPARQ